MVIIRAARSGGTTSRGVGAEAVQFRNRVWRGRRAGR